MIETQHSYKLSGNLISTLKEKGIVFLANAKLVDLTNLNTRRWKKAKFMWLVGDKKEEWDNYLKGLTGSGFVLNNENDILLWSWDTKKGLVNAKQAYEVQMLEKDTEETNCYYKELGTWQVPLKIKLFFWLMLEQRILTRENLVKRGFLGPSRCVLCGKDEETVLHLFVECNFTNNIWTLVLKDLKLKNYGVGGHILEFLKKSKRK